MKAELMRNLRCQWRPLAQCLGIAAGLTAFLCLCCVFCAPVDAIAQTVAVCFGPFAVTSWLMMGIGTSINFYTQSAFLYLTLGTTRAGIFAARQIANFCFCAAGALVTAAGIAVTELETAGMGGAPIAFFGALFLLCQLSELSGLLAYRYGKWGMIFYTLGILLLCAVAGCLTGMVAASRSTRTLETLWNWLSGMPFAAIGAGLVLGGALTAAVSWRIFRRAQVKV